ncbi:hypothetical protein O9K51_06304 [Purpureocillium lavendulum]|uniref:Killer toxin Kp4 domain-containing protein n=1 Tax=Purpureocillium lavendulum TaxID=1247861 RepID=A0AB34FMA1_9HYPO|nr:hypothetical protein O9K51_06304 [Purpureocillium lavendulum]
MGTATPASSGGGSGNGSGSGSAGVMDGMDGTADEGPQPRGRTRHKTPATTALRGTTVKMPFLQASLATLIVAITASAYRIECDGSDHCGNTTSMPHLSADVSAIAYTPGRKSKASGGWCAWFDDLQQKSPSVDEISNMLSAMSEQCKHCGKVFLDKDPGHIVVTDVKDRHSCRGACKYK